MPPRYAYWTILIDNQPTAFRATKVEELLPTFNRLKQKNPSAVMMWSQFGKLWKSPEEAMAVGKTKDPRQVARPPFKPSRPQASKPSRPQASRPSSPQASRPSSPQAFKPSDRPKLEWKPKGTFTPVEPGHSKPHASRPSSPQAFKPSNPQAFRPSSPQAFKPSDRPKLEWKPKGSFTPAPRRPRPQSSSPKPQALSPKPYSESAPDAPPRKPRAPRVPPKPGSKNWRPGGDHQDPRQKYLDAKKAKWTRFKKAIRDRHDKKNRP